MIDKGRAHKKQNNLHHKQHQHEMLEQHPDEQNSNKLDLNNSDLDFDEVGMPAVIDGEAVEIPEHTDSYINLDKLMSLINYNLVAHNDIKEHPRYS